VLKRCDTSEPRHCKAIVAYHALARPSIDTDRHWRQTLVSVAPMATAVRSKKALTFYLPPELLERMEAWISRQDCPPSKTAVFETALREFLERRERGKK